jgi:hypothetical protein
MVAQLYSNCQGDTYGLAHSELGTIGSLTQSPDENGDYLLVLDVPIMDENWHMIRRDHEEHKFRTRSEAKLWLMQKFHTRFSNWV